MFNFEQFCKDNSIQYEMRKDNVFSFKCPLCSSSKGSRTLTGGYIIYGDVGFFKCFRCGNSSIVDVIMGLTGCDIKEAFQIRKQYETDLLYYEKNNLTKIQHLVLPQTKELDDQYSEYLKSRNLNPDIVVPKYNLKFTMHFGDERTDLPNRIIFPVYLNGKEPVTYTARSIDPSSKIRYRSCADSLEVVPIKHTLYNLQFCDRNKPIAVVEGCLDSIHFGDQSVAVYGIEYNIEQVMLLKDFKKVFIIFDSEKTALSKANSFARHLKMFTDVSVIDLESEGRDLGDFNKEEIKEVRKYIGFEETELENLIR